MFNRKIKEDEGAKLNCTPFVRQYGILNNKWGVFYAKRKAKSEVYRKIKQNVVEPMTKEQLSYQEKAERFRILKQ